MIHIFIGTKAQYVKMAPLLWRMDRANVKYRLIDSGQHASLSASFRRELGLREPDFCFTQSRSAQNQNVMSDVTSVPQAMMWALRLSARLLSHKSLRNEVFASQSGICVVHGDTPTTLLSTLMARRAKLPVAHVEAGLRTYRWFHPFPEEIVRVLVGRFASVLFPVGAVATANLRNSKVKGRIVEQSANTVIETVMSTTSLSGDLASEPASASESALKSFSAGKRNHNQHVVVTMHRVENLNRKSRREGLVSLVERIAKKMPVQWVMHAPTAKALSSEVLSRLTASGVKITSLVPHADFLAMIQAAPFVITDGGSIQEECAFLGVPTLLWRGHTDRDDGLDSNVVLSRYKRSVIEAFLEDPKIYRRAVSRQTFNLPKNVYQHDVYQHETSKGEVSGCELFEVEQSKSPEPSKTSECDTSEVELSPSEQILTELLRWV